MVKHKKCNTAHYIYSFISTLNMALCKNSDSQSTSQMVCSSLSSTAGNLEVSYIVKPHMLNMYTHNRWNQPSAPLNKVVFFLWVKNLKTACVH